MVPSADENTPSAWVPNGPAGKFLALWQKGKYALNVTTALTEDCLEHESEFPITSGVDRQGEVYEIERVGLRFNLRLRGAWAGTANCYHEGAGVFRLADIQIFRNALICSYWPRSMFEFFGMPQRYQDMRGRGLGTALLREIIGAISCCQGAEVFRGFITDRDLKAFPGLPTWYEGKGFMISAPTERPFVDTVWEIRRHLGIERAKSQL